MAYGQAPSSNVLTESLLPPVSSDLGAPYRTAHPTTTHIDQSWIDPGAAVGGEGGRACGVAGAGVAGAVWAGMLDAALGGGSVLTGGVSTGSSLCTGLNRVNGGLLGGG
jgi:hypothetical protein